MGERRGQIRKVGKGQISMGEWEMAEGRLGHMRGDRKGEGQIRIEERGWEKEEEIEQDRRGRMGEGT